MRNAMTIQQVKEEYRITRYVLMKWQREKRIKLHRPNGRDYIILRSELEEAIKAS